MDKFDNPLDAMASMSDPEPARKIKSRRPRVGDFDNPLDEVTTTDKARAVDSSLVAGRYIRRTFTFTPGQLVRIKAIARELHISETGIALNSTGTIWLPFEPMMAGSTYLSGICLRP
jgi:hypothetical protein